MELKSPNQIFNNEILSDILRSGLIIVGQKGCGKSNVAKILARELINDKSPKQLKIFDTCLNWRFGFDSILFQTITPITRFVYSGKQHIIYDIAIKDTQKVMNLIEKIVMNDYDKQRKLKELQKGLINDWKIYIIEEAQNILASYSLSAKSGKSWLKLISEGRNFGLSFVFIGQRLADISVRAIERTHGYFFGKMVGDNDLAKIRRICGRKSKIDREVSELDDIGEFVYYNGTTAYKVEMPLFQQNGQPKWWIPEIKPKKRRFW